MGHDAFILVHSVDELIMVSQQSLRPKPLSIKTVQAIHYSSNHQAKSSCFTVYRRSRTRRLPILTTASILYPIAS